MAFQPAMGYSTEGEPPSGRRSPVSARTPKSVTPTLIWLEQSPLPSLEGAAAIAERLVLLIHYGVDFTIWGGARRVRYWEALAERVRAATYAGPLLPDWWASISTQIVSSPRDSGERIEMAGLLSSPDQREVMQVLRTQAQVLVLRVRVLSETRKAVREAAAENDEGELS